MKLAEIEVGRKYAVLAPQSRQSRHRHPECVEVKEVGVHGEVFDGWRHRESERPTYVRGIRHKAVGFREGQEDTWPARSFWMPWADWTVRNRMAEEKKERKEKERVEEKSGLQDAVDELGLEPGRVVASSRRGVYYPLTLEEARFLLEPR